MSRQKEIRSAKSDSSVQGGILQRKKGQAPISFGSFGLRGGQDLSQIPTLTNLSQPSLDPTGAANTGTFSVHPPPFIFSAKDLLEAKKDYEAIEPPKPDSQLEGTSKRESTTKFGPEGGVNEEGGTGAGKFEASVEKDYKGLGFSVGVGSSTEIALTAILPLGRDTLKKGHWTFLKQFKIKGGLGLDRALRGYLIPKAIVELVIPIVNLEIERKRFKFGLPLEFTMGVDGARRREGPEDSQRMAWNSRTGLLASPEFQFPIKKLPLSFFLSATFNVAVKTEPGSPAGFGYSVTAMGGLQIKL